MQLGGPKVMGVNGVSHHLVADDLEGVHTVLQLLSYVPHEVGADPLLGLSVQAAFPRMHGSVLTLHARHDTTSMHKLQPLVFIEAHSTRTCLLYSPNHFFQVGAPPALIPSADPEDRLVGYSPQGEKLDPRAAITGAQKASVLARCVVPGCLVECSPQGEKLDPRAAIAGAQKASVLARCVVPGSPGGAAAVRARSSTHALPSQVRGRCMSQRAS